MDVLCACTLPDASRAKEQVFTLLLAASVAALSTFTTWLVPWMLKPPLLAAVALWHGSNLRAATQLTRPADPLDEAEAAAVAGWGACNTGGREGWYLGRCAVRGARLGSRWHLN